MQTSPTLISFIGAGPGAPDLITLRGARRLAEADILIWAASLVPADLLDHCRADVMVHDSKVMTLEEVCGIYEAHPDAAIARLHSGDPTVYGAIGEQIRWCQDNNRRFEVIPGVSSVAATAAAVGSELTSPAVSQSVVLTRHATGTRASMPDHETIEAYAATGATLAVFLSAARVEELADRLLAPGSRYTAATPVVVGHRVSWPDQAIVTTTIGGMVAATRDSRFEATTLFLVGPALDDPDCRRSHVYDPAYTTRFRPASGEPVRD